MSVTFKCFAQTRELANTNSIVLHIIHPNMTLRDCLQSITNMYPKLDHTFLQRCRFAYQNKYIENIDTFIVKANDIITIVSHISGG